MPRVCTVCAHPARLAIDRALVASSDPYRDIAGRYGLTRSALVRHKADHVTAAIIEAWQRERAENGAELASELRGWMDRLTKLLDACDTWLTDPDDPTRYDLNPRAHEVWCHYETIIVANRRPDLVDALVAAARAAVETPGQDERLALVAAVQRLNEHDGSGQEPKGGGAVVIPRIERRKARLSALLDRVDGHEAVGTITLVEHKSADPRKLIIDASKALESHLRLLGELVGKLATVGAMNFLVSPEWLALRGRMLASLDPYPEARLALASAIEGDDELGAGAIPGEWEAVAD